MTENKMKSYRRKNKILVDNLLKSKFMALLLKLKTAMLAYTRSPSNFGETTLILNCVTSPPGTERIGPALDPNLHRRKR